MPDPSDLKITGSDANSWTVEIWDSQGISHVDVEYGRLPFTYRYREEGPDCVPQMTLVVPKRRKFFLRTFPFYGITVCDCSRSDTGGFVVTRFKIDEKDRVTFPPPHERTQHEQEMLDYFEKQSQIREWQRTLGRGILILLFLLFLLALAIYWSALGPLWGG